MEASFDIFLSKSNISYFGDTVNNPFQYTIKIFQQTIGDLKEKIRFTNLIMDVGNFRSEICLSYCNYYVIKLNLKFFIT